MTLKLVADIVAVDQAAAEKAAAEKAAAEEAAADSGEKPKIEAGTEVAVGVVAEDLHELNRVYWKLDLRIIPALWTLYFLTSYGGAAYGNSLTMNSSNGHSLAQVLRLNDGDISQATSLEYVGYILFDLPMNLVMSRVSAHLWLGRIVITVGLVYACFAAATNSASIIALRFLTGCFTAGIWPGMAYYISMWYPADRAVKRVGLYYTATQISSAVAGLLGAAFQRMDGINGWPGYQWMFLIYGCVTMALGIVGFWWLPDRPRQLATPPSRLSRLCARLGMGRYPLNDADEALYAQDMAERHAGGARMWGWRDLLRILRDVRLWPFVIMYFGIIGMALGLQSYSSVIIRGMMPTVSAFDLSLLTAPIWLFDAGGIIVLTPIADHFPRRRGVIFSVAAVITIVGLFVATYARDAWAKWGGLLIVGFGIGPTVPITMSWTSTVFGRRHGDLGAAAASAVVSALGNLGAVTATYALYKGWPADIARGFRDSNMVMVALLGVSIMSAGVLTLLQWRLGDFGHESLLENTVFGLFTRKRSALAAVVREGPVDARPSAADRIGQERASV